MRLRKCSLFPHNYTAMDTEVWDTAAQPPEPETGTAVVLELDEMWHYLKNESYGFGKFCVVIQENSSPGNVVIGIKRP